MHPRVQQTIDAVERLMAGVTDANPLPREACELLHLMLTALRPKLAVEIGTSYGYSGLWIASALADHGGRLITIDHTPRKSEAARRNFEQAGLLPYIELRTQTALEALPGLPEPIDFVLNDADKQLCRQYVELLVPKLSPRGLIVTDNTRTHAAELASFLEWLGTRKDLRTAEAAVGNGMAFTVKVS